MQLLWVDKQIQIMHVVISFINVGAYMNILFIIKLKILVLIKWSYSSPQSRWLLNLEKLANFEHVVQSLLTTCLFWCPSLNSHLNHTVYHSNTSVETIAMFDLDTSTLISSRVQDLNQVYIVN
jgi:hypothetical protein